MKDDEIFSQDVLDFIHKNRDVHPYTLALRKSPFQEVDMMTIARQVLGRKIAKKKFPFLLKIDQYRYPKKESLEQASSEAVAIFKSKIVSGNSFVDLTGGMGIDTYLLGKKFLTCAYIEPNLELYKTTAQNFRHLGFSQCLTYNTTCENFLSENGVKYDWAYIDPSRRIDGSRKTSIYNYEPNLVELQNEIARISDNILVKLSPMQDISECVNTLNNVHKIWVISVKNEVKELLLHLKNDCISSPTISAIDLNNDGESEFSQLFENRVCTIKIGEVKKYLYQPSAAIVKAELQNRYASQLGLVKLNANTQLYTSDQLKDNFMGKVFLVEEEINLNKKELKRALPQMKANVITKNFPLGAQELIRKYKLKEGGEKYLIAFRDFEERKVVVVCARFI